MRRKLIALFTAGALVFGLLAAGCSARPRTIRLAMGYIPNVQFAPWYVAQEKGYFKQAGLDVTMDYARVNDIMRLLAAEKVDFAIAGGDEVIVARSQGLPVTYVMSLYARFPAVVVSLKDSKIEKPEDLRGKKVGYPYFGTNYIAIRAIMASAGLTEKDVTLIPIGYTQVASLTQNKVDAVVCFANNEPVQLEMQGVPIHVIYSYDYFDLVGHGLVTSVGQVEKSPAIVRAFVKATRDGMQYALKHPDEAFKICLKYAPDAGGANAAAQRKVLAESMKLWESQTTRQKGLGYSDPAAWDHSQKQMSHWGIITRSVSVGDLLNNTFLR